MRVVISPGWLRAAILVGPVIGLAYWPVATILGLWGLLAWIVPRMVREREELLRLLSHNHNTQERLSPSEHRNAGAEIAGLREQIRSAETRSQELQAELADARVEIAALRHEITEARRSPEMTSTIGHPVFRRVGLVQDCPKWVAEAVRREYRKRLHRMASRSVKKLTRRVGSKLRRRCWGKYGGCEGSDTTHLFTDLVPWMALWPSLPPALCRFS